MISTKSPIGIAHHCLICSLFHVVPVNDGYKINSDDLIRLILYGNFSNGKDPWTFAVVGIQLYAMSDEKIA